MDWLLESGNPSVRYYTLRDLLGKTERSREVRAAKKEIMAKGVVPKILAKQSPEGFWAEKKMFYRSKYKGTTWQLIILAQLGAEGTDPRVRKACEFILHHSQHKEIGGFSVDYSVTKDGGSTGWLIPCLTGNMVWSLVRLGCLDDPRVRRAIDYLAATLRCDDKESAPPKEWPYDRFEMCYGRHSCHMGVGKTLKAFAEIPVSKRGPAVARAIDEAVEYFLRHHIFKKSHDLAKASKPSWLKFGFPLMYQDDVLEMLEIMAKLEVRDARLKDAIDLVESKRGADGRWILENTFNGRTIANIEQKSKPSKWITLKALQVLNFYRG